MMIACKITIYLMEAYWSCPKQLSYYFRCREPYNVSMVFNNHMQSAYLCTTRPQRNTSPQRKTIGKMNEGDNTSRRSSTLPFMKIGHVDVMLAWVNWKEVCFMYYLGFSLAYSHDNKHEDHIINVRHVSNRAKSQYIACNC
jgi:hypothetical protein